ncbi:heavy metal translocating P-type ATPase [Hominifimenecus sp. rT4P-3]|uniref:heavy metal translocating P-type ATPase n=1 Tax=Hominifimenecus sp. rT4P-3 TaxID=3242979 RepID=UPI003DA40601
MKKKIYDIHHIDCANCAAKIEHKINQLPEVQEAILTFATKQLRITAEDPDALLSQIQAIAEAVEPGVIIAEKQDRRPNSSSGNPFTKKVYYIHNIDCANCAAKIERKINQMPEVQEAILTFATKQLRITAEDPDAILPEIQAVADAVEPGVVITKDRKAPSSIGAHDHRNHEHQEHEHDGHDHHEHDGHHHHECHEHEHSGCSCGCEHGHLHAEETQASPHTTDESEHNHPHSQQSVSFQQILTHPLTAIISGAVLFLAGELTESIPTLSFAAFLAAYLILGAPILKTAGKNLLRGKIFDENFLMSVATLGAFAIRDFGEAVGVMLFYRIGEYFEDRAVERSRKQIMEAADLRPETVQRIENGRTETIPAEIAFAGDILLVRPGDRIPLDGVIIEGESRLDTSPLTGEPVPVPVTVGSSVLSGCVNTSGLLKLRVEKPLEESMVSRILESVENAAAGKPQMERFITRFARIYTPIVLLLALGTAVIPSLFTGNWNYWVYTALTFLVISCPCALVLSVPLAFFSGIGAGSKRGILFKGGLSLEAMKKVKAIVMDKTGTITEGTFALRSLEPAGDFSEEALLQLASSCEISSTHPIGQSIRDAASAREISDLPAKDLKEIAGEGIQAILDGSEVLCGNRRLLDRNNISYPNLPVPAGSEVLVAKDGVYIGRLLIFDQLKEDSVSAISQLKAQGLKTVMLTGDTEEGASQVAAQIGVDHYRARLLPDEKLSALQEVRNTYGPVMFVGDGINDAPVLAGADVGAAMGSGADAAIEAADAVFMTSRLSAIPQALKIARTTNQISIQNVVFALIVKILVMILGLTGKASMWMAVFADSGVAMLCVLNSIRVLYKK